MHAVFCDEQFSTVVTTLCMYGVLDQAFTMHDSLIITLFIVEHNSSAQKKGKNLLKSNTTNTFLTMYNIVTFEISVK